MLLLSKTQGTGKDSVLLPVRTGAVGADNWSVVQLQDLQSAYNGHWAESQVVLVIELPDGQQRSVVEIMKGHIASVAGDRTVNPKYVTPYRVPDRISWIATTNHEDAVDLKDDDRRFAVLQTREERMSEALANELHSFYDAAASQRGLQLVGEWLRQRTISADFNPKRCPPPSLAKQAMQRNSISGAPAEQLLDRLTHQDAQGSLAHRTLLWHREVQEIIQAAQRDSRWRGKNGHVERAMKSAGWQRHGSSGADGRLQIRASRAVDGKRPGTSLTVWSRADDKQLNALSPRLVVHRLLAELREAGRVVLAQDLAKLLK
ncbi:primase-helicase family protein [Pseudoroseomonas sp. WGS1072]|uniref:primase-helicase family protein n=1 Tax=Roseomonas sp. WGS1072 TaxID=3366816 RepID=UPI003BF38636